MSDRRRWPQTTSILNGGITIAIYHHEIPHFAGDVNCWTYVSAGLRELGQPELVVTLLRRPDEDALAWSREPLEWFKIVASWGRRGRIIDAFHTHLLESAHWLGGEHLGVLTFGMPMELSGLPPGSLPRVRLHGIVLTPVEANIAKAFGWTRAIAHYGLSTRWFPYTPWIDRDRTDTATLDMMSGSMRGGTLDPKKLRGVTVRWKGRFLLLDIPPGREDELRALVESTPERAALSLDSALHPEANFCATWKSGQSKALHGYGAEGFNVKNFAFIAFCPEQRDDSWMIIEDGCALLITDMTWKTIRAAISSKQNTQLRVSDDLVFCLVFSTL